MNSIWGGGLLDPDDKLRRSLLAQQAHAQMNQGLGQPTTASTPFVRGRHALERALKDIAEARMKGTTTPNSLLARGWSLYPDTTSLEHKVYNAAVMWALNAGSRDGGLDDLIAAQSVPLDPEKRAAVVEYTFKFQAPQGSDHVQREFFLERGASVFRASGMVYLGIKSESEVEARLNALEIANQLAFASTGGKADYQDHEIHPVHAEVEP